MNWVQSRTQVHVRCASCAAAPTIGDSKELNKLVLMLKLTYTDARFWRLECVDENPWFPDAPYRNNADKSSQRAHVIMIAQDRKPAPHRRSASKTSEATARGLLVGFVSHKTKATTQSTAVAELHALMKCFGTCLFLRGLWTYVSGEATPVHIRTDANNLATTAGATRLPEQKETRHLI